MIHTEAEVHIERPADAVFAFLADARNEPQWLPGATRVVKLTDGPVGLGTRFEGDYARAGTVQVELVAFERPRRLTFRANSKMVRFDDAAELTPDGSGTRLRAVMDAQPQGVMRLMGPMMGRVMRKQFTANWLELKRALEAQPAPSVAPATNS